MMVMDDDGDGDDVIAFCLLGSKRKFPNGSRVRGKPKKEKDGDDVTCFSSNKKIWLRSKIRSKPKKKKEDDGGGVVVVVVASNFVLGIMKFD